MGRLLEITVRPASGEPVVYRDEAAVSSEAGLDGDYGGQNPDRQVTVISREAWEAACAELGTDIPWTTRRANLLVEGVDLEESTGKQITIGDVVLHVTGETHPCPKMDAAYQGLREILKPGWRAGATCRVAAAGSVRKGDPVSIKE